jgi:hypothetical protein
MTLAGTFGNITNPFTTLAPNVAQYNTTTGGGLVYLISNLYKLFIVLAGIYLLFNLVLAGYAFMGAAGDPKLMQKAQERIWKSVLGLLIIASSLVFAAIIGYVIFGTDNWDILINPRIYT